MYEKRARIHCIKCKYMTSSHIDKEDNAESFCQTSCLQTFFKTKIMVKVSEECIALHFANQN